VEENVAYALFENDAKLSRSFPTEDSYVIKPCPPDAEQGTSPGIDLLGLNKLT
jgi:hypothetical protein